VHRVSEEKQSGGGGAGEGPSRHRTANGKTPRVVVPIPQKRELCDDHMAQLRGSGLTEETAGLAELWTEHHSKNIAELLHRRTFPRHCGWALVFPFYVPGKAEPVGYRVRPSRPRVDKKGKAVKYEQAEDSGTLVYFTPRARAGSWYGEIERVAYWTEGEKKALAFDQLGLVCVGLTGVNCWHDKQHKDETGEWRLHPVIAEHVAIAGRKHIICFDADAPTNDKIMHAAQRLCGVLLAAGAASVSFVHPPSLAQKGLDDYLAAFGEAVTRALLDSAGPIDPLDPKSPLQLVRGVRALREAPVNDNLRLPEGYEVPKDGALWKIGDAKHGPSKIARAAMLLMRYLDDYYTHDGRVDLCFEREGRWVTLCVARKAIADSRSMVADLTPFGAPVTSNSAPKLVDWFEDFERVNAGLIERVACVGRAGWHTIDAERVFVLHEPVFEDPEHAPALALDTRGDRRKLFDALKPRGELSKHIAALRRAWQADPVAAAIICGAACAPLLEPLGAPNFAIHLPGDSSRGKTSMLKIASSVYGDPSNDSWVASWNTTSVAAELRAAVLTDLPQCYDEVGSGDPQAIERLVYMLVNGGGRARGQRDLSLRETPTWHTVVLSTGERELADESTATGAQIRVVQLPVAGFGQLSAAEIDELRETCAAHSGSFGRYWIETLLGIDDWEPYRQSMRDAIKLLRSHAQDPLQGRVAAYFAVLCVTEGMLSQLGLGEPGGKTMELLFRDQGRREAVRGLADRALGLARDWVMSEPEAFPELEPTACGDKPARSSSRQFHGFRRERQVLFIPSQFRSFCEGHRLSSREVLRAWAQRDWLQHEPGRLDKDVRIGVEKRRFYVLEQREEDE
jgi:hypothetical protein